MISRLDIENFKSIYKESIELGRVNVFIGENGCGKTNILEALGMISVAKHGELKNDYLALKGIRVTKPSITLNSFLNKRMSNKIKLDINYNKGSLKILLKAKTPKNIDSAWEIDFSFSDIKDNIDQTNKPNSFDSLSTFNFLIKDYIIYNLSTQILRGINPISREIPGIHGENLDLLINSFSKEEMAELVEHSYFISWLDDIIIDKEDRLKLDGHKLDLSTSILYFKDKFMQKSNNIFSAENANEGILHILFYLALFISKKTPQIFAIDNIETALNPRLCRHLMEAIAKLAKKNDKQVLITTHNPAILDGLNLHDDEQRLFTVSRNKQGHTKVKRLQLKPDIKLNGKQLKLSELWMRGHLGAIPQHF